MGDNGASVVSAAGKGVGLIGLKGDPVVIGAVVVTCLLLGGCVGALVGGGPGGENGALVELPHTGSGPKSHIAQMRAVSTHAAPAGSASVLAAPGPVDEMLSTSSGPEIANTLSGNTPRRLVEGRYIPVIVRPLLKFLVK